MPDTDYYVRHHEDEELWWNNETGWGGRDSALAIPQEDIGKYTVPMEGVWWRPLSAANKIEAFMHCGACLKEKPEGESPASFARFSAGWTKLGFQLRCERHDLNVIHIDFRGHRLPANTDGKDG